MCRVAHLEYGYPGVADVVEIDSSLVGVVVTLATHVVVLVPVNTAVNAGRPDRGRAFNPALRVGRHVVAAKHAVLPGSRADKRAVLLGNVVGTDRKVVCSGWGKTEMDKDWTFID